MSAKTGAPEKEPEITPAMIEAGAEAFAEWSGGAEILIGTPRDAAEAIFRAMIAASESVRDAP